ncbi:hypothetical protein K458DRAFT_413139 [Lentithecium fluviatile CBS 122367]|uniref:Uncharacterized protein n=1 Tax=Lentithecium fluviatile CBS 122367 TaxID=1168545 RepID=A0A6G1JJG4_9PLEO|nr:hypothetical protein K458DRAFT_413139 [Lentithecium fluviatile CBS 122367]
MCLQRWRSASDTQPTCRSAGSYFQGRRTQLSIISPCCVPLQRAETSSRLLGLGIGAGGLKKHEDVVA